MAVYSDLDSRQVFLATAFEAKYTLPFKVYSLCLLAAVRTRPLDFIFGSNELICITKKIEALATTPKAELMDAAASISRDIDEASDRVRLWPEACCHENGRLREPYDRIIHLLERWTDLRHYLYLRVS